jgi:hypothetical protein
MTVFGDEKKMTEDHKLVDNGHGDWDLICFNGEKSHFVPIIMYSFPQRCICCGKLVELQVEK